MKKNDAAETIHKWIRFWDTLQNSLMNEYVNELILKNARKNGEQCYLKFGALKLVKMIGNV